MEGTRTAADVEALARAYVEAFNEEGIDAALRFYADDFRWYAAPGWLGKPVYPGREGARELAREWTEHFGEYRWDVERVVVAGDRFVVLAHHRGRMRGSDALVDAPAAAVVELREDGLFGDTRFFFGWDEALEAAGLAA